MTSVRTFERILEGGTWGYPILTHPSLGEPLLGRRTRCHLHHEETGARSPDRLSLAEPGICPARVQKAARSWLAPGLTQQAPAHAVMLRVGAGHCCQKMPLGVLPPSRCVLSLPPSFPAAAVACLWMLRVTTPPRTLLHPGLEACGCSHLWVVIPTGQLSSAAVLHLEAAPAKSWGTSEGTDAVRCYAAVTYS